MVHFPFAAQSCYAGATGASGARGGEKAEASAGAGEGIYFCEAFNVKSTEKVLFFWITSHIMLFFDLCPIMPRKRTFFCAHAVSKQDRCSALACTRRSC